LFLFDPEVVIRVLPKVILQQEKEAAAGIQPLLQPSSRPTISGQPAPLIIKTSANIAAVNNIFKVFNNIKTILVGITNIQDQLFKNLQVIVQKLESSATTAITKTVLIQGVNKELIESADYLLNRKKVSKKEEDKISDTRVLSLEMIDKTIEIKAAKKKEAEEELAKEKRLKAQTKA
jgi:hypothetical protein